MEVSMITLYNSGAYVLNGTEIIADSADAAAILDAVSEQMIAAVADGNRIEVRGFGTFQPRARATKIGYNPCTGKPMHLAAGTTILFKPSRELTKKMNG